jgi:AcrR family transcriptional regulator
LPRPLASRGSLNRAAVVRAAAELVNAEGAQALTINRLARELGIQPPSLYNHIGSLEDLRYELALLNALRLADRLAEAAIGKSGTELYIAIAHSYRSYIKEFPGLYLSTLRVSNPESPREKDLQQEEERSVRIAMTAMATFGLQGEDAVHAVRAIRSMIHGFALLEIAGGFGLPLDCDESFSRMINFFLRGLQNPAQN